MSASLSSLQSSLKVASAQLASVDAIRADQAEAEFAFSEADFERIRRLIYEYAGIALSPSKRNMVYSRLSKRLRLTGHRHFESYLNALSRSKPVEWEHFVNALTTNLTYFFREPHHFETLAQHLQTCKSSAPLSLWCNAASTGEEPYTLAMVAAETFNTLTPPVRILATDIDTQVLAQAQAACYTQEQVHKLPESHIRRYFLRHPSDQNRWVIRPELKALITFKRLNLLDKQWPIAGNVEAIFCRNVLIYFDRPTQLRIVERMAPLLTSTGLLFVGHSENFSGAQTLLTLKGKTVYSRNHHGLKDSPKGSGAQHASTVLQPVSAPTLLKAAP